MDVFLRPRFEKARDSAEMQVWYMYADSGIKAFAPNMMMLAVEAAQHDEDAQARPAGGLPRSSPARHVADLRSMRRGEDDPPFSDELITHAIFGGFEQMLARAGLDDEYSWRDCRAQRLWASSSPSGRCIAATWTSAS